jgi:hypothetical protein
MLNNKNNPWVDRYRSLLDPVSIKERALVKPKPLEKLFEINIELACNKLKDSLETAFYPTRQCVDILQRLVGVAYAHSIEVYPSNQAFISRIYDDRDNEDDSNDFAAPICLTGLSGIGKSEILKAFKRLVGQETYIKVDTHHPPFHIRGPRLMTLKTLSTPTQIAKSLFNVDVNAANLASQCRNKGFQDGIPFFMLDESQFATASSTANARITQILLSLSYIGIPFLFSANFSLLHRLLKRPEEDRQRLLSKPIILLPDEWESECWINTLRTLKEVAPDVLKFDPVNDAKKLHGWTAGRKRALVGLIIIAFRYQHASGKELNIQALEKAYLSPEFYDYRHDSEIIANQIATNQANRQRKELWCPIPIPESVKTPHSDNQNTIRDETIADIELKSSLTASEKAAYKEINGLVNNTKTKTAITKTQRNEKQTSQDLLENTAKFKESMGL